MSKYIKYQRIEKLIPNSLSFSEREAMLQQWLDELISQGLEIIYYNEFKSSQGLQITIITGKERKKINNE